MRPRRPDTGTPRALALLIATLTVGLAAGAGTPGWVSRQIRPGDSLWQLARDHGTTVAKIMSVNGLTDEILQAGDVLYLPGSRDGTAGRPEPGGSYLVQPGDSLSRIAAGNGLGVSDLAGINGLDPTTKIYPGQRLLVPTPGGGPGTRTADGAEPPLPAAAILRMQQMIRGQAARQGVDPSLALAIASVESDFDQRAVSSAGAVGVMQLTARTARWLSVVLKQPLDRHDPADNIAGGVAFLHFLLGAADLDTAVAGYYQGLDSVQRRGPYPDTRRYVAKVLSRRQTFA
jgi:N-acetylmuramoyl-L-alanine amidase